MGNTAIPSSLGTTVTAAISNLNSGSTYTQLINKSAPGTVTVTNLTTFNKLHFILFNSGTTILTSQIVRPSDLPNNATIFMMFAGIDGTANNYGIQILRQSNTSLKLTAAGASGTNCRLSLFGIK